MSDMAPGAGRLPFLLRLDRARMVAALRRPGARLALGVALPAIVLISALWTLGRIAELSIRGPSEGLTIGLLLSGMLAFLSYGVLFGSADDLFLSHVGVSPRSIFQERSIRLGGVGALLVVALAVPFAAAGESILRPLLVGLAAAAVAVGVASLSYAKAAVATAHGDGGAFAVGIRQWDPGLARAAPLVYAPLLPFLAGGAVSAAAGAASGATLAAITFGCIAAGGAMVHLAARSFAPAAGRFFPTALEMSYAPPPEGEGEAFRVGRGLSALLPRRAAAVWVRDAAVGHRRFGWAARVTWPVAIVSIVALARWGDSPATRAWVVAAVGVAVVIQAAAVVGLGIAERAGPRWVDRALGISWWERYLGRFAWGWGLSLWLLVPVALAWAWWSGQPGAALWPLAGAFTAAAASAASLLNAERR